MSLFFPLVIGFRPPFKPSLSCKAIGHDGASEESPYKVDEVAASSREIKIEDRLYSFSVFAEFFPSMHLSGSSSYGCISFGCQLE